MRHTVKAILCCAFLLGGLPAARAAVCSPLMLTGKLAQTAPVGSDAYATMQATACVQQAARKDGPVVPVAVAVVSASLPALSGVYGINAGSIANITAAVAGIAAGQGFPGGSSSMVWVDATGAPHTFGTTAEFLALGAAIEGYVYALQMTALGQAVAIPATPLQIP